MAYKEDALELINESKNILAEIKTAVDDITTIKKQLAYKYIEDLKNPSMKVKQQSTISKVIFQRWLNDSIR